MTPETPATAPEPVSRRLRMPRGFAITGWEVFLFAVLVAIVIVGATTSPFFLTGSNLSIGAGDFMEIAVMALAGMLIIVVGEIDLSVASTLGLASVVLGLTATAGLPLLLIVVLVILTGIVAGAFNGLLITAIGLPSIVVTIGTLGLYRGLAYGIYGSRAESTFPQTIIDLGTGTVPATLMPWAVVLFAILAIIIGVVLHRSVTGRYLFAAGLNPEASIFSGVRVGRIKFWLFVLSGALAAVAALIYTGRVATARADNGLGLELQVIAVVLLGGVSIFGGSGSLLGVILSLLVIGALRNVFTLNNVGTNVEMLVIGLLMIAAVVLPRGAAAVQALAAGARIRAARAER